MTSVASVLETYDSSSPSSLPGRTKTKLCTGFEHLGHTPWVDITAEDVVRRYLWELMRARFATKTALAQGMGTSRSQLQVSIEKGRLTVDQMNALATAMGSSIFAVMKELSGIAEQMERGRLPRLSDQEVAEMLGGPGRERRQAEPEEEEQDEPTLPGEVDRLAFSGGSRVTPVAPRAGERRGRVAPPQPPRPPVERNQKRSR